MQSAVNKRNEELKWLGRYLANHEKNNGSVLTPADKPILSNVVKKNVVLPRQQWKHIKKLRNLTKSISLPFNTAKTVHNLSSKLLTTDEMEVLK